MDLKKIGKAVIQNEIDGLKKLKLTIGKSFEQVVKTIIGCKNGRIIISGVGKSGIIAKKWVATFSSTGTPSFFLDAANASHGDMGQISSGDVVILISLSGESEELKNIIQFTSRNKNIKLVGITSKKESLLYRNSDIKLLMPNVKEAGPDNFIPTSSTTNQLALGDSIAVACMKNKKFGKIDFKKYHPGGSLATKLKTAADLMLIGKKIPIVHEDSTMKNALKTILKKGLGMTIVKNKNRTTGILTDGDLKRLNQKFENLSTLKVKKVMKKNPVSIEAETLAAKALEIMNTKKITSLCVHKKKERNKTVGILHIHNILKANIN